MEEQKTELEHRLEAAREKKRAASARLAMGDDEAKLEEVELEEREAAGEEALANAVEKYGRKKVGVARSYAGWVVLRQPNHIAWRKFQDVADHSTKSIEKMVRKCVAFPDANAVDRIFEEIPSMIVRCGSVCTDLAQGRIQDLTGK